jgi:hypothetical protein
MSIQLNSAFSLLLSAIVTLHSGTPLAESRISSHLQQLQNDYARHQGNQEFSTQDATLNVISSTHVMLTITSTKELVDKARIQLQNLGMTHIAQYKHLISGVLQIDQNYRLFLVFIGRVVIELSLVLVVLHTMLGMQLCFLMWLKNSKVLMVRVSR